MSARRRARCASARSSASPDSSAAATAAFAASRWAGSQPEISPAPTSAQPRTARSSASGDAPSQVVDSSTSAWLLSVDAVRLLAPPQPGVGADELSTQRRGEAVGTRHDGLQGELGLGDPAGPAQGTDVAQDRGGHLIVGAVDVGSLCCETGQVDGLDRARPTPTRRRRRGAASVPAAAVGGPSRLAWTWGMVAQRVGPGRLEHLRDPRRGPAGAGEGRACRP